MRRTQLDVSGFGFVVRGRGCEPKNVSSLYMLENEKIHSPLKPPETS